MEKRRPQPLALVKSSTLTPEHVVVDSPVLGLAPILTLVHEGELHELQASLLQQLEHSLVFSGGKHDLEVIPRGGKVSKLTIKRGKKSPPNSSLVFIVHSITRSPQNGSQANDPPPTPPHPTPLHSLLEESIQSLGNGGLLQLLKLLHTALDKGPHLVTLIHSHIPESAKKRRYFHSIGYGRPLN